MCDARVLRGTLPASRRPPSPFWSSLRSCWALRRCWGGLLAEKAKVGAFVRRNPSDALGWCVLGAAEWLSTEAHGFVLWPRHGHRCRRGSGHQTGVCQNQAPAAAHREQDLQDDAGWRWVRRRERPGLARLLVPSPAPQGLGEQAALHPVLAALGWKGTCPGFVHKRGRSWLELLVDGRTAGLAWGEGRAHSCVEDPVTGDQPIREGCRGLSRVAVLW